MLELRLLLGRLRALGIEPCVKAEASERRFPYVAFSAPPSGSDDYVAEVRPTNGTATVCMHAFGRECF